MFGFRLGKITSSPFLRILGHMLEDVGYTREVRRAKKGGGHTTVEGEEEEEETSCRTRRGSPPRN